MRILEATPEQLMRMLETMPTHKINAKSWASDIVDAVHRPGWRGATWDQIRSARSWPEGRRIMEQYAADLAEVPAPESIRRVRRWGTDGDEFSRDRFDAGYDECWQTRKRARKATAGRVVSVTICFGGNHKLKADQLAWSGAAGCLLVDKLEEAGYRCELTALHCVHKLLRYGFDRDAIVRIPLKAADEPLDIDRVVMVTAAAWFHRTHVFRLFCELPVTVTSRYGSCRNGLLPDEFKGDIHMPSAYTLEDARKALADVLAKFSQAE